MEHFADIPCIALGEHVRLARHFFLVFGLLHEQVTRGGFPPDDFELALAAAHLKPFFGTGMCFEFHEYKVTSRAIKS